MEEDQLKLLARGVQPADEVVAGAGGTGLRVFVEAPEAVDTAATVLRDAADTRGGRGPIRFCLIGPGLPGEVEIELGDDFPVSPQIRGALRSLPGVATVEEI